MVALAAAIILVVAVIRASDASRRPGRAQPRTGRAQPFLYAATSPFNRPIPANPAIDPDSSPLVGLLAQVGARGGFLIAVRRYTVPIYMPSGSTPRSTVSLRAPWAPRRALAGVPVPTNATPDPSRDGHLAIVDRSTRCEFDFWRMRRVRDTWSAAWGNSLRTDGSGIYRRGFSARGSGFALLAGVILPAELARGDIPHALLFSYPYTSAAGFVSPATESDGRSPLSAALPEGAHLQLDPRFDISGLPRYEQTIARALQRYGMYLGDTGSGNVSLYAANPQSYSHDPYAGTLPGGPYVRLPDIPLDGFRVLAHGPVRRIRPHSLVRSGCGRFR
jgi:hypothetical protein